MKTFFLALIFTLCTTNLFAQTLNDLNFITEEYPPFNFSVKGQLRGISTDTLVEMLKLLGAQQTRKNIGLFAWARDYNIALKQENAVLFSTTRTEAREKLFKWVGPIISSEIVLYARKDRHLSIGSIDDLNRQKLRVGVVLNDVGEQLLLEKGIKRAHLFRFNKGVHLAEMLARGRIDLLAYDKLVTLFNLKTLGFDPKDFEAVYVLKRASYYYALNTQIDDQIVLQLQQALDQLKTSGAVDAIVKHYLD
ncbi:substrate-binding periplasmic protein [Geopsychrobacter electrodiphilus]|uniref:substrate-binding periplasmic protein n=1 Tax=Geopsychrobacter electrodiphilus TaxID=225196 RepID=UPI0003607E09|nr:ABC transporter substrate-binding protein [Geopsychrobacter electrodiphilus]